MIIRFLAKNVYSFKEQTEFNLLPSSKTTNLPHHKIKQNNIEFLRYSAIYGGNGVGKSNLIKAISLLEEIIEKGRIPHTENIKFRIGEENKALPISLGIEFVFKGKIFFYTLTFDNGQILHEYLAKTFKDKDDELVFERYLDEAGTQKINFNQAIYSEDNLERNAFLNAFSKLVPKDKPTVYFLTKDYSEEFEEIKSVYDWFDKYLVIIRPNTKANILPHILDIDEQMKSFANDFIPNLSIGISSISIEKKEVEEVAIQQDGNFNTLKENPDALSLRVNKKTGEQTVFFNENGKIYSKRIVTSHNGTEFNIGEESDGTRRLFDYIPALRDIIHNEKVYIIDEIERSIHPLLIKEIVSKLALDKEVKGQLIFTTHESNLLNQSILRPDEIWLTEKNQDGATEIYPLSDFKIHNTINIENGYLSGRYGGIPILSNLKELNW